MRLRRALFSACCTTLIVACQSDRPSEPRLTANGPNHTTTVGTQAAPQFLTIFPGIYITGTSNPAPTAVVSTSSISTVDRTIDISSSDPTLVPGLPTSVTILAGDDRVGFEVNPATVSVQRNVTLTATGAGVSTTTVLTLLPPGSPEPPAMIDSIFATPNTVAAGKPSTATVKLTAPAPAGGTVVALFSNLQLTATMPAAVLVPAGARTATVPIATFIGFPNSTTTATLEAAVGATIVHNGLNVVTGNLPTPFGIKAVTLSAPIVGGIATVTGGTAVQATISLTAAAPSGGSSIVLVSTDTTAATVPSAPLVIPAGASSGSFVVTTKQLTVAGSSNIGGIFAGGALVTTLRVNPGSTTTPPPPPPPVSLSAPSLTSPASDARFTAHSTVNFTWSAVTGASTYTIQISTSDKFSSTIVNQTVSATSLSIATLPTQTMWWRVRANGANGTSSAFSGSRRFELK